MFSIRIKSALFLFRGVVRFSAKIRMSDKETKTSDESGYLVHLFAGDQNSSELAVLCKICMKYGLTCWDIMTGYLPWRNRAALRTTMCRVIRKQALSEYDGIRADPLKIQKDNDELIKEVSKSSGGEYTVKGGVLVNARWDRSPDVWQKIRKENATKYEISQEEADTIEIPSVISIDYMRQQCFKRRQSLLIKRAALRAEKARRDALKAAQNGETVDKTEQVDLGVQELQIRSGRDIVIPKPCGKLETSSDNIFF